MNSVFNINTSKERNFVNHIMNDITNTTPIFVPCKIRRYARICFSTDNAGVAYRSITILHNDNA